MKRRIPGEARYRGAVCVVTGAASGIGAALVVRLVRAGAKVVALDLRLDPASPAHSAYAVDVRDREAMREMADRVVAEHGRIDLWINNAGIGAAGELAEVPYALTRDILEVNLFGVLHGMLAVYPHLAARGAGQIVNVASLAGLLPLPGEAAYVASKYAVVGLSRAFHVEARARGVIVTTVCPGHIATPIYATSPVFGFRAADILDLWPSAMSADDCAGEILAGVARERELIVVTTFAKLAHLAYRAAPGLLTRALGRYWAQVRARREASPEEAGPEEAGASGAVT